MKERKPLPSNEYEQVREWTELFIQNVYERCTLTVAQIRQHVRTALQEIEQEEIDRAAEIMLQRRRLKNRERMQAKARQPKKPTKPEKRKRARVGSKWSR